MRRQLHSLLFRLSPRCKGTVNGQPEPATPETRAGKVSGVCVFRSASFARRSTFSLSSPCLSNTPSAERIAAASSCADGETETGRKRPLAPETSGTGGSNPSCSARQSSTIRRARRGVSAKFRRVPSHTFCDVHCLRLATNLAIVDRAICTRRPFATHRTRFLVGTGTTCKKQRAVAPAGRRPRSLFNRSLASAPYIIPPGGI